MFGLGSIFFTETLLKSVFTGLVGNLVQITFRKESSKLTLNNVPLQKGFTEKTTHIYTILEF